MFAMDCCRFASVALVGLAFCLGFGSSASAPAAPFAGPVELSSVGATSAGALFAGTAIWEWSGYAVASAGDVNNDGLDDLLIGAPGGNEEAGNTYLIYGRSNTGRWSGSYDLTSADAVFHGMTAGDWSGRSVSSAGDVNGDGCDDLLIGAYLADPGGVDAAGAAYLVYGRSGTATLSGALGLSGADVLFQGLHVQDSAGCCVSSAGDVNGDGLDDLLIGAYGASSGENATGAAYLVYGRAGLAELQGTFALSGADAIFRGTEDQDFAGYSVSSAGDVNGDDLDDLLIGAYGVDDVAGATYLIYGRSGTGALSGAFQLADADVIFQGIEAEDRAGASVSSAGDVNGDGLDDLLIGAYHADANGNEYAGAAYLVHGRSGAETLSGAFDLATADAIFLGSNLSDRAGISVASAGDVNADGLDDLLIGASDADPGGTDAAGKTYLFHGRSGAAELAGTIDLATADAVFHGIDAQDFSGFAVSAAGDVNGDGIDDLVIGASDADPGGLDAAGETYLLYGPCPGDLNHDAFVGGDDLDLIRSHWGQSVPPGDTLSGDPTGDGFVGGDDLDIIRAWWGWSMPPVPASVPEPSTTTCLIMAGLACWVYRWGR